ncbi:pyridoxal phosphate-dependent transferase [Polychytrium aggregatum]|uniref:pyridoxal phosphate-dependent transferase n=1 Tax=Polychytrium aggregatum TaxID=110093 RepID=UPI0022FDE78D|nr:pyridoxal phosphate-dependent transferase [Polychytrium aggregatum]KAI9209309.1 pyridoxal phosphate-dependent transferase [Polychytrium aggregatum]
MDYSQFFSPTSASRKPSAIRQLQKFSSIPGMISLGGGNPNPTTFPFSKMSVTLRGGEVIDISEADVQVALQYSATNGLPNLVQWLRDLQLLEHRPKLQDFDICVGNGSQDVLTKAFEMLAAPGDSVLVEAPAYVGALAFLRPLGVKFVEVEVDESGPVPDKLEQTLQNWPADVKKPKFFYTVPAGGNPTGLTTTLERKHQIYEIAKRHNFIILEDDPYYYLQFNKHRIPSYFSFDSDGRVLRFDSFSKILSAGIRVGWVSGPKALVERIVLHGQASFLHPSGISQAVVSSVLHKWGHAGFLNHVQSVAKFYEGKRDAFIQSADKWLKGVAEWNVPTAGMFVWIKLLGIDDSSSLIQEKAMEKKVVLVPGFEFFANPTKTPYVRAAYSIASESDIDTALMRLGELVREATQHK